MKEYINGLKSQLAVFGGSLGPRRHLAWAEEQAEKR